MRPDRPSTRAAAGCLGAALALTGLPAWSVATYDFTSIAQTVSGGISSFDTLAPGIAADGTVVFLAQQGGQRSIRTGAGGLQRIVVDDDGAPFDFVDHFSISDSGLISFIGFTGTTARLYVIDENDLITKIAEPGDTAGGDVISSPNCLGSRCQVANDGTVVFLGFKQGGGFSVYAGSGGPLSTVAEDTALIDVQDFGITQNNAGQRGVKVEINSGNFGESLRILDSAGSVDLFISSTNAGFTGIGAYALNDNGAVALTATLPSGVEGVFLVGNDGTITPIADNTGPYDSFGNVGFNDFGKVVFTARLDASTGFGIYSGADPIADKIVAVGDVLFGKTVTSAFLGRESLNDSGRVAFRASYAGDERGIVRANPQTFLSAIDPALLNAFVQLSTLDGDGVGMSQLVPLPHARFDFGLGLQFLGTTGEVSIRLGDLLLGVFGPQDGGPVLFSGINPRDLFDPAGAVPAEILLELTLSGPAGATVRLDDVSLPGIVNGDFQGPYLSGWSVDTSRGGTAFVSALDTPVATPAPGTVALLLLALAGVGARRLRGTRLPDRSDTPD